MADTLKKPPVDIAIVGFGWTGAILASELAATGLNILALERGEDRDKKQLRAMQDAVLTIAGELNMPEGLLASRKLLEALQDGGGWTGPLAGWRRGVLEARLQPLLTGACTA